MREYLTAKKILLAMVAFSAIIVSCKKFEDPPPFFEEYGVVGDTSAQRRVLVVVLDGAAGSEMSSIAPPNISALQKNSKYTYKLWMDASNRAAGLASIVDGVTSVKHQIGDSTFVGKVGNHSSEAHANIPFFPSMFRYILERKPNITTAVVSSWKPFVDFLRVADFSLACTDDAAVRDTAVGLLKKVSNLGATVVNFGDAYEAGKTGAFLASNAGYKAAVERVDGYIGDLINAIKQRPGYAREDWLVMVVSPYAGSDSASAKQGFLIVSNPKLKEQEVKKVGYSGVRFAENDNRFIKADLVDPSGLYDGAPGKDFTAQITVKFDGPKSWPGFFGKSSRGVSGGDITGWVMIQSGSNVGVIFGGSENGTAGKAQLGSSIPVTDGNWHTITMVVKQQGGDRRMYLYVDGETNRPNGEALGDRNLVSNGPLTIGYNRVDNSGLGNNKPAQFNALNAVYFDKALDQATIRQNKDVYDITRHTEYNSVIGYWPLNEGLGPILYNKANAGQGLNFVLSGPYKWYDLSSDAPRYFPLVTGNEPSITATSCDVAALMMYWLKVDILPAWNLDGKAWLRSFDKEFLIIE